MPADSTIAYVRRADINQLKWDECLGAASNSLIYGYSFYLDNMAGHWDALVMNDYEAVMPLPWRAKFGFRYAYQPAFTANLGVFGKYLSSHIVDSFLTNIPRSYRLVEISLNPSNLFNIGLQETGANYFLNLNSDFDTLFHSFRENHQRNIEKALQSGCYVATDVPLRKIVELNKQQLQGKTNLNSEDYNRFERLYTFLSANGKALTYGVYNKQNTLLSSAVFFLYDKRAYYILVGNDPGSRGTGASHALLNAFIKEHAGQDLVLDFEGSDIESLAHFYVGFGSTKEVYPKLKLSHLSGFGKWVLRKYQHLRQPG